MRIVTGDECGLLKEVIPELGRPAPRGAGAAVGGIVGRRGPEAATTRLEPDAAAQGRERGVVSLAFLPRGGDGDGFGFAALRANGVVEAWSAGRPSGCDARDECVTPVAYARVGSGGGAVRSRDGGGSDESEDGEDEGGGGRRRGWYARSPIRPIGMVSSYGGGVIAGDPVLAACDSVGTVSLLRSDKLSSGAVATYNAFDVDVEGLASPASSKNKPNGASARGVLTRTKGGYANAHICTSLALCGGGTRLAVGGRERGARVLELETGTTLWKAKNMPPDPQTLLQQPMWTTAMQFLHTPTSSGAILGGDYGGRDAANNAPTNLLATGTAYKQVQIYDVRQSPARRRPALHTPDGLLSHRITALCQLPDGNVVAAGDAAGDCHLLDLRRMRPGGRSGGGGGAGAKRAREEIGLGRLVGPGGSIRQMAMHPRAAGGSPPILACVGLDRKLWTWDVSTRKVADCVYLKQRLNCLLFCEDGSWDGMDDDDDDGPGDGVVRDGDDGEGVLGSGGAERERELEKEEDEVKDYVGSDEDDDDDDGKATNVSMQSNESGASSEETESESSEEDGDDSEKASDDDVDDESTTSEEDPPIASPSNPKKRRRK